MPVSPESAVPHVDPVVRYATEVEYWLLQQMADTIKAGADRDDWDMQVLASIRLWRERAERHVTGSRAKLQELVEEALISAQTEGIAAAIADIGDVVETINPTSIRGPILSAERFGEQLGRVLQSTPGLTERWLRQAVQAGSDVVINGSETRLQAAQRVLDRLAKHGIVGFRDDAGRNWSMTAYVEMAVRTETAAAAIDGYTTSLQSAGLDLVVVSDSPRECPLCRPFEGKILSLSGQVGGIILPSVVDDKPVKIDVTATLNQARSRGFQHPNCTHRVTAYLPGVERPEAVENASGYEEKQRQRQLERNVRSWKRAQALALDEASAKKAQAKVRESQQKLNDHIKTHKLKRLSYRTQIQRAH